VLVIQKTSEDAIQLVIEQRFFSEAGKASTFLIYFNHLSNHLKNVRCHKMPF